MHIELVNNLMCAAARLQALFEHILSREKAAADSAASLLHAATVAPLSRQLDELQRQLAEQQHQLMEQQQAFDAQMAGVQREVMATAEAAHAASIASLADELRLAKVRQL